ncbi:MAG: DUF4011 domain-containing protein [Hyphomonadaceae bacterium]|nr:DUF4011 domain-containing protein [Hyphomonadaceae bacterium]GIK49262.1 MAG: hypothetical protein BroJett013_19590 [Alphaproteobacteria bacterium]
MPEAGGKAAELAHLVEQRVARMRPKLLDLSRRNPLISTSFSGRSNALLRIVDELPEKVVAKLSSGSMRFRALPDLENDPKDEEGREFQDALSDAKRIDETYLGALADLEAKSEADPGELQALDRALRDRVRLSLGMEARQVGADISLAAHARAHGISPGYDLPLPNAAAADGRFDDRELQTLMLAEDLERRLNGLLSKGRSWLQETGVNVMHVAVGFVEWTDPSASKPSFAPLLLAQVEITKHKTPEGAEFSVKLLDEELTLNDVFAQKLRGEFSLDLPQFNAQESIEAYFSKIDALQPHTIKMRVRRQVAFGVFPSARIAMFHDLGTQEGRFGVHPVISALLGGAGATATSVFAEEYAIDEIDVATGLPPTVLDADSSQLSALIDALSGKDMALEGPPGTGKSQTIVNVIAAAIERGKKVLFIAEKMAALEVVQSRLRSLNLDGFVLPLQATRSSREQVIQSLRDRMTQRPSGQQAELVEATAQFRKARADLASYLAVLALPYRNTGWTIHDVLGRAMSANATLSSAPAALKKNFLKSIESWTPGKLEAARNSGRVYEEVRQSLRSVSPVWRGVGAVSLDRFSLDGVRDRAQVAAAAASETAAVIVEVPELDCPLDSLYAESAALAAALREAKEKRTDLVAVSRAVRSRALVHLMQFVSECQRVQKAEARFSASIDNPLDSEWPTKFERLSLVCQKLQLASLDREAILARIEDTAAQSQRVEAAREHVDLVAAGAVFWTDRPLSDMEKTRKLVAETSFATLLVRDPRIADAAIRTRVREAAVRGEKLAAARKQLLENFATIPEIDPASLRAAATILRNATFLARFGEAYKGAKSLYRGMATGRRYKDSLAADQLHAAADYKDLCREFERDSSIAAAFPEMWRELDTDFASILDLAVFADGLERNFPGLTNKNFRQQILGADLELLQSLPELDVEICAIGKPSDLSRRCDDLAHTLADLESGLREIDELVRGLKQPAQWNADKAKNAASATQQLQRLAEKLDADRTASDVLGAMFQGWRTPTVEAENVAQTATQLGEMQLGAMAAAALQRVELGVVLRALDALAPKLSALDSAMRDMGDVERFAARVRSLNAQQAAQMLSEAANDHESLQVHAELSLHRRDLDTAGLSPLLNEIEAGWEVTAPLSEVIEAVVHRGMALDVYEKHGNVLGLYAGSKIDLLRKDIADLDGRIVKLTRDGIRRSLLRQSRPPPGVRHGKVSEKTQMALIEHETAKTKAYIPVRNLVDRASQALLDLKPCWMMSPLAVAQYVPPHIQFDLCIIDEASQMPPEDALGAVLRSKQVLVVGDTNQLPPTSFFKKLIDDGEDEEEEGEKVVEESILEMANAVFRPARQLRWHYRSKHGSLIAFSNNHIYDDNLIVFPSAEDRREDRGVALVRVNGRYRSSVNPEEAKAIVAAAIEFMVKYPERSLGLVTVNQKQRDLILEELQTAVNLDERASAYIEKWAQHNQGLEEFFVKNLENVQGDERDAIFISTVYGPSEPGQPMHQRFGPITGVAGRRRLNVLFSRAKQQIVTFTSMDPTDIRVDEHGNAGAHMLRCWLEYSKTGVIEGGTATKREPDSEFEVFVMRQLTSMGVEVVPQVGVAGYFVDIGVRHPDWPHGFILGVECDGASYHSAPSARDRDRLRQSVLEGLGWRIHRIWSTDWFLDPSREAGRLRNVIEARLEELRGHAPASISSTG